MKNLKKPLSKALPFLLSIKRAYTYKVRPIFVSKKEKVFCIGFNKTGTTTLEATLKEWGFKMGWQREGERLITHYFKGNYDPIIRFGKTAEAFQDVPFSLPHMYEVLDQSFPNAKFILTVRDDAEQWYNSVVKFQKKVMGTKNIPSANDLKNHKYHWKGYLWDVKRKVYGVNESNPYDKEKLKSTYEAHIQNAQAYFKGTGKLLTINVGIDDDYYHLAEFLNKPMMHSGFFKKNATK